MSATTITLGKLLGALSIDQSDEQAESGSIPVTKIVFDHRQVSCEPKPLTPSVRKSVNAPHVTQIVTISQRRRVPSERRCVAAAHRTSAGGSTKIE